MLAAIVKTLGEQDTTVVKFGGTSSVGPGEENLEMPTGIRGMNSRMEKI